MSGVISDRFGTMVPNGELEECIEFLEDGLRCLTSTPYHQVLGKHFLERTDQLADWLVDYCKKAAAANVKLAALYLEMNGFSINPAQWHCDLFGYHKAGDIWDLDWLAEYDAAHDDCFVLTGMEDVQKVYAQYFTDENHPLGVELAEEITSHLVTARFMQLVGAAHEAAKAQYSELGKLQIFASAHDWDVVHKTE